jgi:hypothetical protein
MFCLWIWCATWFLVEGLRLQTRLWATNDERADFLCKNKIFADRRNYGEDIIRLINNPSLASSEAFDNNT